MMNALARLTRVLDAIADRTGRTLAWLLPLIVLGTVATVVLRYAFSIGAIWLQELVMYLHAAVFLLGIPYALRHDGHVRVDLVYARLPSRPRHLVNLVGAIAFLFPVAGYVLISSWSYAARAWAIGEVSPEVGGLPAVYLLKSLVPLMAALLIVQGVAEVTNAVRGLAGLPGREADSDSAQEATTHGP